ncbi:hypothetical protein AB0D67_10255 [Streptosporangium sp. NPDC048047]|uniref:hypothetical protein n=1 Tax=Streptosporangium sp. NPDC048047 TaxID=3155748 RepID=UPI0034242727
MSVSDAARGSEVTPASSAGISSPRPGKRGANTTSNHTAIRRGRMRGDRFTQISNDLARDHRLTRRARGLFVELASHREGWQTSLAQLAEAGPEGTHALRVAIAELEQYGYLVRSQMRDPETGRVAGTEYWITDCPEEHIASSDPSSENRMTDAGMDPPSSEPSCGFPTTAYPTTAQPISGGRTHKKNTIHKNTNDKKTTSKTPASSADAPEPGGEERQSSIPGEDDLLLASQAKKANRRRTKERSPEEQARFELAGILARGWWDRCAELNIPNLSRGTTAFVGFRAMVERALAAGCTENELKWALEDLRDPFPSTKGLQNAIGRRRGVITRSHTGRSTANRRIQVIKDSEQAAQQDERREMFG